MRKDDPKIQGQRQDNLYMTYYNGQYTNEFGEMEDLGFGSAHPTGRERGFASNLPSVIKAKAMFDKLAKKSREKQNEKARKNR